jgi:hypothetical protein
MVRSPTETAVLGTSAVQIDRRRRASWRLAMPKSTRWPTRTTPYAITNVSPRSSKASGTQSAATSSAAIAANMASRTPPSSGSTTLVSHA